MDFRASDAVYSIHVPATYHILLYAKYLLEDHRETSDQLCPFGAMCVSNTLFKRRLSTGRIVFLLPRLLLFGKTPFLVWKSF